MDQWNNVHHESLAFISGEEYVVHDYHDYEHGGEEVKYVTADENSVSNNNNHIELSVIGDDGSGQVFGGIQENRIPSTSNCQGDKNNRL